MKKMFDFIKIHKRFTVLMIVVFLLCGVALFAPEIATHDPNTVSLRDANQAPNELHYFGTDVYGRDLFSRVVYGARFSIGISMSLVIAIFLIGMLVGMIAGYFGGIVDSIIMRISDVMIAFPDLILALAIAGILGSGLFNAFIAILVTSWPKYARMSRSIVLKIKSRDYMKAGLTTGSRHGRMIFRYIFPNVLPTMLVTAAMDIGAVMLAFASLSFLGFGIPSEVPEWGAMINDGRLYMDSAPWLMFYPGCAIFFTISLFNLVGDSVRDILDPKSD